MKRKCNQPCRSNRRGAIALLAAFLLIVVIGIVAFAVDIGWIVMTRTQLQAVADSSSLAGGTELMPGLGLFATKTPAEVAASARPVAQEYAGKNPNAEINSSYVDQNRDVKFGKAIFLNGAWQKTEGAVPYNYVEVTTHRDQGGSGGDRNLPLFFARIFEYDETTVLARATAVILPANGFTIEEGSDDTAGLMPFAFSERVWERYKRAQEYFDNPPAGSPYAAHDTAMLEDFDIKDTVDSFINDEEVEEFVPLFLGLQEQGDPNEVDDWNQIMFDNYTVSEGVASPTPDEVLEISVYPHKTLLDEGGEQGNFGTIDFGAGGNSAADLKRQIEEGLNEEDLSYYENNTITIDHEDPFDAEGDTGISGGIEASIESIIGDCRAIVLFSSTNEAPGNNRVFELVDIVGVAVVEVELSGNNKRLVVQPCTFIDDNAIGDVDEEIGEDETVFTPLILIE